MTFKKIRQEDLPFISFPGEEIECVHFEQCDLSGKDLSDAVFIECLFDQCNLSNAKLSRTAFRECVFESSKLIGLHFDDCIPFLQPPVFRNADLQLASFLSCKLTGIRFEHCQLKEVDFSQAVLAEAVFIGCDLTGAVFEQTDMRKADIRTSFGYSIDPEQNSVRQLQVSAEQLEGFLTKYGMIIR
jgi:uncharacterized protein YjbI with pentapeptide repeats